MGEHPSAEVLERFLRGELASGERRQVVGHLLGGCGECARGMAPLAAVALHKATDRDPLVGGPELEESYHDAIERAFAAVRLHGARAPRVKQDKARVLEGLRRKGLKGIPRTAGHAATLEAALERARELLRSDPAQMICLQGLISLTAGDLLEEGYTPGQVADFRARAAGEYANALRINHMPLDAEKWLDRAFGYAEDGTGDPWLYVQLLDLLGSLHISRYKYRDALLVLEEVYNQYKSLGDRHLAGRTLIQTGRAIGLAGHSQNALALLDKGASMITRGREPDLEKITLHNQVYFLAETQRFDQALHLVTMHRAALWEVAGPKLLGTEARILVGLDHLDMAEDVLKNAKALLQEAEDSAHAGLASLDLAALFLKQGRTAEGRAEAAEALAIYKALKIEPEARRALSYLEEALRSELATAAFLQRLVRFLRRLEHQPWLRFTPAFV